MARSRLAVLVLGSLLGIVQPALWAAPDCGDRHFFWTPGSRRGSASGERGVSVGSRQVAVSR